MVMICPICNGKAPLIWSKIYYSHQFFCPVCNIGQLEMIKTLIEQHQRAFIFMDNSED